MSDPFQSAEGDLQSLLTQTRSLLSSYTRIRATAASPTSPELLSARQDLTTSLEDLAADLQDLIDAVKAVEGDPYRYGLDVAEVERRRRLVRDVGEEIEGMRGQIQGASAGKGSASGNGLPNPAAFDSDEEGGENEDDTYGEFEQQRQQEMLEEQDEQLEGVFRTVGNLRMQADEMGRELEEQGQLLDSVDTLADRVGGKLNEGIKKVGWVIKKNEGKIAQKGCLCLRDTDLRQTLRVVAVSES